MITLYLHNTWPDGMFAYIENAYADGKLSFYCAPATVSLSFASPEDEVIFRLTYDVTRYEAPPIDIGTYYCPYLPNIEGP
jgi:hypothetical protein